MGFEYGSQTIEINNPFRLEGAAYLLRGLLVAPLGGYLMVYVPGEIPFAGGVLLLGAGLYALGLGIFKVFRFYVGRGVPANLARTVGNTTNIAPGSQGSFRHAGIYDPPERLSEMLVGRKNFTFEEPRGWLSRLMHGLSFRLLFLPRPMRWIALKLFMALWYVTVTLAMLGLMLLYARAAGYTDISATPVAPWLGAAALLFGLAVWIRYQPSPVWRNNDLRQPRTYSSLVPFYKRPLRSFLLLAVWAGAALFLTGVLLDAERETALQAPPVSPWPWLGALVLGVAGAFGYALLLALRRAPRGPVPTEVSEYRAHWQESVHPMDIFRAVDMTLANHRYREIPNRVYLHEEPDLLNQGSQNKGEFSGETLQEIQPVPLEHQPRDPLVLIGVVLGQAALGGAGVWVFLTLAGELPTTPEAITAATLGPVLLWLFGRSLAFVANLYLGEVHFQSQLIAFRASGTYAESRLATGMSIYDSTRSENTFVRSSLTPWLVLSRIHSSVIAVSGTGNLEQPRYVLAMEREDGLCSELVSDVQRYLREREVMASVQSQADLEAASNIHDMNQRTRGERAPALGHAPLSEDLRHERLGHGDPNDE